MKLVNIIGYCVMYKSKILEAISLGGDYLKGKDENAIDKYRYDLKKFWTEYLLTDGEKLSSIDNPHTGLVVDLRFSDELSKKDTIIGLFTSLKDNSTPAIAKKVNMGTSIVDKIIKDYLKEKVRL